VKLYDSTLAPNPRRVRIYLAEKGLKVPSVQVDIGKAENRATEYLKKNPMGGVPILELDDGSILTETIAICRYFEEQNPNPPLFGTDARDKAFVEMWQRRMELNLFNMTTGAFRNTHAFFKGRIPQVPEYGQVCKDAANKHLEWLDGELAGRKFIAGDRFTIADIILYCALDFGGSVGQPLDPACGRLTRWMARVAERPSAKASLHPQAGAVGMKG
jgi:glutathione S-transferase